MKSAVDLFLIECLQLEDEMVVYPEVRRTSPNNTNKRFRIEMLT